LFEHESAGWNPSAVSKTGAKGLNQGFEPSFIEAQKMGKRVGYNSLDNETFQSVNDNPNNWKKQIDSGLLYLLRNKANLNPESDEKLALHYLAGDSRDIGKLKETAKQLGSDPDVFLKSVFQNKQKYQNLMQNPEEFDRYLNNLDRKPAFANKQNITGDEESTLDYLTEKNLQALSEKLGKSLSFGPYANPQIYGQALSDQDRMTRLREEINKRLEEKNKSKVLTETPNTPNTPNDAFENAKSVLTPQSQEESEIAMTKRFQESADKWRMLGALNEAFGKIGGGIAGAMSGFAVTPAKASEFFNLQAKAEEGKAKELIEARSLDPNSNYSNSIRQLAKQLAPKMGVKAESFNNMSGAQILKIFPQLEDIYDTQIRSEATKLYKQQAEEHKNRLEAQRDEKFVNQSFNRETKDLTDRIIGANKPLALIKKIRSGDLIAAKNLRKSLTNDVASLLVPTGARAAVTDRTSADIDTAYGRLSSLASFISGQPTDTIPDKYLDQLEIEIKALKQEIQTGLMQKVSSLQAGTRNPEIKNMYKERADAFLYDEEQFDSSVDPELQQIANKYFNGNLEATKEYYRRKGELK
jgi:hypothetical protein